MDVKVFPSTLSGSITALSSKSQAHRVIIASALADRSTKIIMNNNSMDIRATLDCIKALGARTLVSGTTYTVYPADISCPLDDVTLNANTSASTLRFLLPVAGMIGGTSNFIGEGGLVKRPIKELLHALKGVGFSSEKLPFTLSGKLLSGEYFIEGNISSQYISGLMFALPLLDGDSKINIVGELTSKPYIDMTISVLNKFGVKIESKDYGYFIKGNQKYISPESFEIEGDYSNASFFMLSNYLGGNVSVLNLMGETTQGDKDFTVFAEKIVKGGAVIDVKDNPDLVPVLAVLGAFSPNKTKFINAGRLKIKESDRLKSVVSNINKMGGYAESDEDTLTVTGTGGLVGGCMVDSFADHRIAMAFSVASCFAKEPTTILDAGAVSKSYPDFYNDLRRVGGIINVC